MLVFSRLAFFCSSRMRLKLSTRGYHAQEAIFVQGELLTGFSPVLMALKARHRQIHQIYYNPGSKRSQVIVELASNRGIAIKQVNFKSLDRLASLKEKKPIHQGVIADVSPIYAQDIRKQVVDDNERLWILACGLRDPMNLGAILRTSYYLGVDRVIFAPEYPSCPLSPMVSKASAGVLEIFPPFMVPYDTQQFLVDQMQSGWEIIGSEGVTASSPIEDDLDQEGWNDKPKKILVLGNEGAGIPPELEPLCQRSIHIPPGRILEDHVDSLNVSVAAALLIQQIKQHQPS